MAHLLSGIRKSLYFGLLFCILILLSLGSNFNDPANGAEGTGDNNPIPKVARQFETSEAWDTNLEPGRMYITHGFWGGLTVEPGEVNLKNISKFEFCQSKNIATCASAGEQIDVQGYAPACFEDDEAFCIEKIEISLGGKDWVQGDFENYWDMTPDTRNFDAVESGIGQGWLEKITSYSKIKSWKSDSSLGLYGTGPGPLMFSFPENISPAGTTLLLVEPHFAQMLSKLPSGKFQSEGVTEFSLGVRPIVEVDSEDLRGTTTFIGVANGQKGQFGTGGTFRNQYFSVNGRSAYAGKFAEDIRVRVSFRAPRSLGGWFHGRLDSPEMSISEFNNTQNKIVIEAGSVSVPATHIELPMFSEEGQEVIGKIGWPTSEELERFKIWDQNRTGGGTGGLWTTESGVEDFKTWSKYLGQESLGATDTWFLKRMSAGTGSQCFDKNDRLQGLVSTNAMVYQPTMPKFESGYLNYEVAGQHYDLKGNLQLGTYDFIVRSETARCIYGYSKAPVSATVTVLGSGDQNIATTLVSEKDGWLKLAAYGFTFSQKEIKVKLTQPYSKTLTQFAGSSQTLSSKQKAEIKEAVTKGKNNPKFICTGTYVSASSKSTALARARAACNYAKSLDKNHSYFAQAKQTAAKSYDAKVIITSK